MSFSRQEKSFLGLASTHIIIPQDMDISLAEASHRGIEEFSLHDIKQRDTLFFDEQLTVYMVLRVPQCPEDELKSYLTRLALKLEVWTSSNTATSEHPSGGKSHGQELIFSSFVKHDDDPIVLVSQDEDDESIYLDLLWEVSVTINRPRMRLQEMQTVFMPIGLISPLQVPESDKEYLEPFKAQDGNLLEPLREIQRHETEMPYLPISRLTSALPQPPKDDHTFHLQSTPSHPVPTHLGYIPKLRLTRPNSGIHQSPLVACLDIDIIPFMRIRGKIESADMFLQYGSVDSLTKEMLPMECCSKDCVTLLFKLEQGNVVNSLPRLGKQAHVESLAIMVKVQLELANGCQPVVQTHWTTNVDFSSLSDTTQNTSGTQIQRTSLINNNEARQPLDLSLQPLSSSKNFNSMTMSFAAMDVIVRIGVPFTWRVLIVNGSTKPAKLAIIPLPRVQRPTTQAQSYAKRHATRSSVASGQLSERNIGEREESDIAQAVIDENIVYAMQHSGVVPSETDLMSLTPELRVGPLGPGQCHEGELKFIAYKSGAFTLDTIRVVDLIRESERGVTGPGTVVDIKNLPDVIVEDPNDS